MNSERLFTVTVTPLGQLSVPSTSCRAISICSSCVCGGCPLLCCCCCCCCAKNDMFRFLLQKQAKLTEGKDVSGGAPLDYAVAKGRNNAEPDPIVMSVLVKKKKKK